LVVKLIDGRWEVMTFTPEHNHPLVQVAPQVYEIASRDPKGGEGIC
jgi:hypothetical protein